MKIGTINDFSNFERIQKSTLFKEHRFQVIVLSIPQNESLKTHHSPTDAFLYVQKGSVNFILETESFLLEEGDLFTFKAFQKHSVTALKDACLLIVK